VRGRLSAPSSSRVGPASPSGQRLLDHPAHPRQGLRPGLQPAVRYRVIHCRVARVRVDQDQVDPLNHAGHVRLDPAAHHNEAPALPVKSRVDQRRALVGHLDANRHRAIPASPFSRSTERRPSDK
jgi:hypothetical protein